MITVTATIRLSESEARALWESRNSEEPEEGKLCPTGEELAEWVGDKAHYDLESVWQDSHGINPDIETTGESSTERMLKVIVVCDHLIDTGECDAAELSLAKEERDFLKQELGCSDLPENSENELEGMLEAYKLDNVTPEQAEAWRREFDGLTE